MGKATYTRVWVNRTSVDVQVLLSQHLRSLVDSPSRSIKDATKHVLRNTQLQALSRKLDCSLYEVSNVSLEYRGGASKPSSHRFPLCLRTPISGSILQPIQAPDLLTCTTALVPTISQLQPLEIPTLHRKYAPLASRTCPDLTVPSGSLKLTISLYCGNLT